mmetsp:Transcript_19148/g.51471  ORF Transcript_19148/g.51471 Transcript_19148/m.51471 type:complete len:257 (+) Transcript_19148:345-1115(+)
MIVHRVEDNEPRVMADESGCRRSSTSVKEYSCTLAVPLGDEHGDAPLALHLHDRLQRVHRQESSAPSRDERRGEYGFQPCRAPAHVHTIEEGEHPSVRGSVSEAQQRTLEQRWAETAVEPGHPSLGEEGRHGLTHARAVPVLVVHGRPQPHQRADLQSHGHRACEARAEGAVEALLQRQSEHRARGLDLSWRRRICWAWVAKLLNDQALHPVRLHVVPAACRLREQRAQRQELILPRRERPGILLRPRGSLRVPPP